MPQSLVKNNIHLVFSTKNRENMIRVEDYEELRAYLIGVLSGLGCYLEELGGTENHIHLLLTISTFCLFSIRSSRYQRLWER